MQLKRKARLKPVIGFATRHADCGMISKVYPSFFITFDYLFELIKKIRVSNNYFEFIN